MIKGSVPQEDQMILDFYGLKKTAKCTKQKLIELKHEIDKSSIMAVKTSMLLS